MTKYAPVGSVVESGYFRDRYTVLMHMDSGAVKVRMHSTDSVCTHRIGLAPWDRIIPPYEIITLGGINTFDLELFAGSLEEAIKTARACRFDANIIESASGKVVYTRRS